MATCTCQSQAVCPSNRSMIKVESSLYGCSCQTRSDKSCWYVNATNPPPCTCKTNKTYSCSCQSNAPRACSCQSNAPHTCTCQTKRKCTCQTDGYALSPRSITSWTQVVQTDKITEQTVSKIITAMQSEWGWRQNSYITDNVSGRKCTSHVRQKVSGSFPSFSTSVAQKLTKSIFEQLKNSLDTMHKRDTNSNFSWTDIDIALSKKIYTIVIEKLRSYVNVLEAVCLCDCNYCSCNTDTLDCTCNTKCTCNTNCTCNTKCTCNTDCTCDTKCSCNTNCTCNTYGVGTSACTCNLVCTCDTNCPCNVDRSSGNACSCNRVCTCNTECYCDTKCTCDTKCGCNVNCTSDCAAYNPCPSHCGNYTVPCTCNVYKRG